MSSADRLCGHACAHPTYPSSIHDMPLCAQSYDVVNHVITAGSGGYRIHTSWLMRYPRCMARN